MVYVLQLPLLNTTPGRKLLRRELALLSCSRIIFWLRTEFWTVSDQSGATALSGFSSRYSLRSCSIGQKAAPTFKEQTFGPLLTRDNTQPKSPIYWVLFYQSCLTFFPVLMLMSLTFSLPVRALSALLLLFLLLLFTRSWGNDRNYVIRRRDIVTDIIFPCKPETRVWL